MKVNVYNGHKKNLPLFNGIRSQQ